MTQGGRRVLVVGGGPAGWVVATLLARAGSSVTLMAPQRSIPCTGESLPAAVLRLLTHLDLPRTQFLDGTHRRISGVVSRWAGQLRGEDGLRHPEGQGFRIDRPAFEESLADAARAAGVVRCRQRLGQLQRRVAGGWAAQGAAERSFDVLIDASGPAAVVARRLGVVRSRREPLIAVTAIGRSCSGERSSRSFVETVDRGWWYAATLPCGRPVAVFHTGAETARQMLGDPQSWRRALRGSELIHGAFPADCWREVEPEARDATPGQSESFVGSDWLACGDAALRLDPLSSQGLFNALATAEMAIQVVDGRDPEGVRYGRRLEEIASLYRRRRRAYLEAAFSFHRSTFWRQQLDGEALPGSSARDRQLVAGPSVNGRSDDTRAPAGPESGRALVGVAT